MFRGYMHQDAHEFLNFTLNEVADNLVAEIQLGDTGDEEEQKEKEEDRRKNEGPKSFVHDIFEGLLTNETKCLECESVTKRDETFLDLSLDIDQNTSVQECLQNFAAHETMDGENKFYCDSCCSLQVSSLCVFHNARR